VPGDLTGSPFWNPRWPECFGISVRIPPNGETIKFCAEFENEVTEETTGTVHLRLAVTSFLDEKFVIDSDLQ
jgi:heme A synthase